MLDKSKSGQGLKIAALSVALGLMATMPLQQASAAEKIR